MARIRAQTVYMLACGQCGRGDDAIVFASIASRVGWMRDHAAATGHDGYLVQDIDRLVTEGHCPLCNLPLDGEGPVWHCETHGAWSRLDDGVLVPVDDH